MQECTQHRGRNVGAARVIALAAMLAWSGPPPGQWYAPGYTNRLSEWVAGGCEGWGDGLEGRGYSSEYWQHPHPAFATQVEGEQGAGEEAQDDVRDWAEIGREPVLPLVAEGDSNSSNDSGSVQEGTNRVKGEKRERASHLRLCHLNVTHWGDAVEGLLEDPDFDIGLFCEMKLNSNQAHRLRKRLRASGWSSVVHPAVIKSRCELAEEQLLTAGAGGSSSVRTWGP